MSQNLMENKATGYISIFRSIKSHWLWQDPIKFQWWLDLILSANYSDKKILIKGTLYECKRGQTIKSLNTWAKEWRTTRRTVTAFLSLLQNDGMILFKTGKNTTHITICNYDSYNNNSTTSDTTRSPKAIPQGSHDMHTNNKDNKDNKEKEIEYPFTSEKFLAAWKDWIEYKKKQHKFTYKTIKSEQQGLNLLFKECKENEMFAIEMLNYAMAKGYKGWIPKDDVNFYSGKAQQPFVLTSELDN